MGPEGDGIIERGSRNDLSTVKVKNKEESVTINKEKRKKSRDYCEKTHATKSKELYYRHGKRKVWAKHIIGKPKRGGGDLEERGKRGRGTGGERTRGERKRGGSWGQKVFKERKNGDYMRSKNSEGLKKKGLREDSSRSVPKEM